MKDCFKLIEQMDLSVNEIRVIGGGARSSLWTKILANVLGRPLLKFTNDDASFGAAMLAGIGLGVFSHFRESVKKCVRTAAEVTPDRETINRYQEMLSIYKKIHDDLADTYKLLRKTMVEFEQMPKI